MALSELYRSLDLNGHPRSIRILELHGPSIPYQDTENAQKILSGNLRVISLPNNPTPNSANRPFFATLSYVWGGDSSNAHAIQIGQYQIRITANCFEALSSIFNQCGPISIWVDSICIDQSNVEERSQQVALMSQVYGQAHTCFAWLGTGCNEIDITFALLEEIAEGKKQWDHVIATKQNLPDTFLKESESGEGAEVLQNLESFTAVHELLSNDWFKRGWTFQELILSPNCVLMTQNKALSWLNLRIAVDLRPRGFMNLRSRHHASKDLPGLNDLRSLVQTWEATIFSIYHPYSFWVSPLATIGAQVLLTLLIIEGIQKWTIFLLNSGGGGLAISIIIKVYAVALSIELATYSQSDRSFKYEPSAKAFSRTADWSHRELFLRNMDFFTQLSNFFINPVSLLAARVFIYHDFLTWKTITQLIVATIRFPSVPSSAIIQTLRSRQVRDIKDKSYALYGVLQSLGAKLPQPDYAQSPDQVFYDLTVNLLRWRWTSLTVLLYVGQKDQLEGPSWVPGWNNSTRPSWILGITPKDGADVSVLNQLLTHGLPVHEVDGNSLYVSAICVDRATSFVQFPEYFDVDTEALCMQALLRWLWQLYGYDNIPAAFVSREELKFVLSGLENALNERFELDRLIKNLTDYAKVNFPTGKGSIPSVTREISQHALDSICQDEKTHAYFRSLCKEICGKRLLFISKYGQIGTGPLWMQSGDEIYWISGLPIPLVLREQERGDSFKVIGPAVISYEKKGLFWLRKLKRIELV